MKELDKLKAKLASKSKAIEETRERVQKRKSKERSQTALAREATKKKLFPPKSPGRTPKLRDLKGLCQEWGKEALKTVKSVMKAPRTRPGDKLKAAELLLAYGYGRPQQKHEVTHEHIRKMTDKQLDHAIVEAMEELKSARETIKIEADVPAALEADFTEN